MDVIRRAISMPLLCRDDQVISTHAYGPGTAPAARDRLTVRRIKNHKKKSGLRETWTRLMDNRHGNKIHPNSKGREGEALGDEGGESGPEDRPASPLHSPQSPTTSTSTPLPVYENVIIGSSVDLAPTLMTIYDSFATITPESCDTGADVHRSPRAVSHQNLHHVTQNELSPRDNGVQPGHLAVSCSVQQDLNSTSYTDTDPNPHRIKTGGICATQVLSQSCFNVAYAIVDENKNVGPQEVRKDNRILQRMADIKAPHSPPPHPPPPPPLPPPLHPPPDNSVSSGTVSAFSRDGGVGLCHSPPCIHGDNMDIHTDAKKRPLSISSTSSSTSSSSSLPRHHRKKVATVAMTTVTVPSGVHPSTVPGIMVGGAMADKEIAEINQGEHQSCGMLTPNSPHCSPLHHSPISHSHTVDDSNRVDLTMLYHNGGVPPAQMVHSCDELQTVHEEHSANSEPDESRLCQPRGLSPISPSRSPQEQPKFLFDTPGVSYIDRVVAEIIETERMYVRDLQDIVQGYLMYFRGGQMEGRITSDDLAQLFGNIEDIHEFNSGFLWRLESCEAEPSAVAECFVNHKQGFLIYTEYCTNYPRSMEVLATCMREPQLAESFKQQQMALNHCLPLGSYLLKPVQRILKYHLFLQNIVNKYETGAIGHEMVLQALESMTSLAEHINDMKRKHEHTVRVQEIQSILYGWEGNDLTTYGDLILEDTFRMVGAKAYRQILLFEKALLIMKKKEDGNIMAKACIMCSNLMLIESIPKEPLSFHLIPFDSPKVQYTVQARTLDQKREWCQEIKRLMLENYSAEIPQKAKELVMMLGKGREEIDNNDSNTENVDPSPKKQYNAPEYLEKRRGRRRSTSFIPDFGLLKSKKGVKKSDVSSPKSSPRSRRRSDVSVMVTNSPRSPKPADINEDYEEEENGQDLILRERNVNESLGHSLLSESQESLTEDTSTDFSPVASSPRLSPHTLSTETIPSPIKSPPGSVPSNSDLELHVPSCVPKPHSSRPLVSHTTSSDILRSRYQRSRSAGAALNRTTRRRSTDMDVDIPAPDNDDTFEADERVEEEDDGEDDYVRVMFERNRGFSVEEDVDNLYSNVVCQASQSRPHVHISDDSSGDYIQLNVGLDSNSNSCSSRAGAPAVDSRSDLCCESPGCATEPSHCESKPTKACDGDFLLDEYTICDNWKGAANENVKKVQTTSRKQKRTSKKVTDSNGSCSPTSAVRVNEFVAKVKTNHVGVFCHKEKYGDDPWIPRDLSTPNNIETNVWPQEPCRQSTHSRNASPEVKQSFGCSSKNRNKGVAMLVKSNSFCSMEDLAKQNAKKDALSHGHRLPNMLVFSNRIPYLSTSCPHTIHVDRDLHNRIARLGTPPRELGPDDLLQEVDESKERGRVVARYATPPRTFSDSDNLQEDAGATFYVNSLMDKESQEKERLDMRSPQMSQSLHVGRVCHSPLSDSEACDCSMHNSQDSSTMFNALPMNKSLWLDDGITPIQSTNPRLPINRCNSSGPGSGMEITHVKVEEFPQRRPGSFHGISVHSVHSPQGKKSNRWGGMAKGSKSGPCSPSGMMASSESIVDSLKNAMFSLTSRLSRKGPGFTGTRSVEASPSRAPRTRSVEDMNKLDRKCGVKHVKEQTKKKDKRSKFIYNLARAYTDRVKKHKDSKCQDPSKELTKALSSSKDLMELLKESKPGSSSVGARIALVRPVVLGGYSLPQHRLAQCRPVAQTIPCSDGKHCEAGDSNDLESLKGACCSNFSDSDHNGDHPTHMTIDSPAVSAQFKSLLASCRQLDTSTSDFNDDSSEFYYEKKLLEDLGDLDFENSERLRELFMLHTNASEEEVQSDPCLKYTIKDTVKLIEHRYHSRSIPKVEIKYKEKAQSIQEIMKNLEQLRSGNGLCQEADSDGLSYKSVRERSRELIECATLTRIRQNSYSTGEDYKSPTSPDEPAIVLSPAKKGYVRHIVNQLQGLVDDNPDSSEC